MIRTSRLTYRAAQFCRALRTPAVAVATASIRAHLSPAQMTLFRQMQPSEQYHAYTVSQRLKDLGQSHPALLTAALLHDIGKIMYPLLVWERVAIVLGKKFLPRAVRRWGEGTPQGLRRPFVVAVRHAEWGADLAARAGAPKLTVNLIRRHQDSPPLKPRFLEDRLLAALQKSDNSN